MLRPHNINHYFGEEPSSENCLFLNLWAPAGAKAGEKRPVIVFIYGGGFTVGSSGMANYGGESMARKGAIFVNFNYRVGALGFLAHPELSREQGGHSGNYGLMDQSHALRWVHDNIARFGARRIFPRFEGRNPDQPSNAFFAAATAASTSSAPPRAMRAHASPE